MTESITYLSWLYDFEQVEGDDAGSHGALHMAMSAKVPAGGQWWMRGDHPSLFKIDKTGSTDLVLVINPDDTVDSLAALNPGEDGCLELPLAALRAMRMESDDE